MGRLIWLGIVAILLTGCGGGNQEYSAARPGGMGNGMMARHHAQVPEEYAGISNPVPADEESINRGAEVYAGNCASCHGDGGMGDGPAGTALDPAPAAIAHTSQMLGDDYLFWRISEGSQAFNTAMPAWKEALDDQSRWDVINYTRALGAGKAAPATKMGGAMYDPQVEAARQAEMLAQAVEQGVITESEADTFNLVHSAVEQYRSEYPDNASLGDTASEREAAILEELVKNQTITQAQADAFTDIHDRLGESGLMP